MKKFAILLPFLCLILMAATGNIRWSQLRPGDRHGNGAYGQSSDGTGTSGNCVEFDAAGNLTDAGTTCGGGGSALYAGQDVKTATTIIGTITLDSTPLTNSAIVFRNGAPISYTQSGATLSLVTSPVLGDAVRVSWLTSNSSPGSFTLVAPGHSDFAPHNLTGDSANAPYVASATTEENPSASAAYKAFDGNAGSQKYWVGTQINSAGFEWLKLDLGSGNGQTLGSYAIQVNTIPEPNRAPKNWTMQGSNDNSTWTTLDTRSAQTSWTSGETRSFTCSAPPGAFRYFRLYITANNGDTNVEVAELSLYTP